jgi:hypothetical protein
MGGQGDSQFSFLQTLIGKNFPNANIVKETDPNMAQGGFDVMMNGA